MGYNSSGNRQYERRFKVYTRPLARLIEQLQRLPGVGPKTAQRLALHILKRPEGEVAALAHALIEAKQQVGLCQVCFHLSAEPVCEICRNTDRDSTTICVVADSRDVIAVERTREYRGKYHVLGGVISPMDGIGPEQLYISPLVRRVSQQKIQEVILAISPSVEGETTTLYVGQLLKPFAKVTRIAFGLPVGGDLEYADEVTLARALEGRRELD
ncbi:recombination mediator RecR [Kamptonema formosum]|uniref:recombination mediator RecR n=1 Tax=Kamptonema formosum TaxID=331992 RepID=UPI0008FBD099|nr:recombination mediator RecR [Oscillatoria sp. PCC 10802]